MNNILLSKIEELRDNWVNEYAPLLNHLKTSEEAFYEEFNNSENNSNRTDKERYYDAVREGTLRYGKNINIAKAFIIQYFIYSYCEYARTLLNCIDEKENSEKYITFDTLVKQCNKKIPIGSNIKKIEELPHYLFFSSFNHFNNFFKHNSKKAYDALIENEDTPEKERVFNSYFVIRGFSPYQDGYYSGNWVRINFDFIEVMLNNLYEFTKELADLLAF